MAAFSRVHSAAAAAGGEKSADVDPVEDTEVVVSGEAEVAFLARKLRAFVGLGAVAEQVAEEPDGVDLDRLHVLDHGAERRQVAVHVREQRDPRWRVVTVRGMGGHRSGLPLAVGVAVVAAGAATVLLRPRSGIVDPATAAAQAYFSPAELARAEDFRELQRILGLGGELVAGAALAWLAFRPPGRVRRALERAAAHPWRGAALAGAGISAGLVVVDLPISFWAHERAVDVGLSTQAAGAWFGDVAKSTAIGALFAAAGAVLLLALVRRFPRHWWAPASVAVVAVAAAYLALAPIVIDPLFNRFDKLPEARLRSQVLDLADRAGVDVGEVYRVDASRRTTGANAYVGGLGHSKRVVLYDNLIDDFPRDETLSVVAHELGHVKHDDVPRGILWIAIVAPAGMFLIQRSAEAIQRRTRLGAEVPAGPGALPAVVFALAIVSFGLTCAGNVLSRAVEARADSFALELTRDPGAFIALERRLALRNVADPDPPKALHSLFGTHPTTMDRIGAGVAYERGERPLRDRIPLAQYGFVACMVDDMTRRNIATIASLAALACTRRVRARRRRRNARRGLQRGRDRTTSRTRRSRRARSRASSSSTRSASPTATAPTPTTTRPASARRSARRSSAGTTAAAPPRSRSPTPTPP